METPGRTRNDAINARRCNSHPTHTGVERRDRNNPTNVRAVDNEPRYGPRPPRDAPVNTRTTATTQTMTQYMARSIQRQETTVEVFKPSPARMSILGPANRRTNPTRRWDHGG